ncbi:MAG TPA: Sua5/YciO/YrdC/YwlC family protein, partial [Desulfurivibrionaceae bacterium]|nr:Sua5/YciO/YrdC/YwlC family protein [Desulfurivibrionaceae bacterium]
VHAPDHRLAANLAPGRSELGVMLPCTPLHDLLLADLGFPIVATSGNSSGEPIAIDNCEALARLGDLVDGFLVHDRPILRPLDDSVTRVVAGRPQILRRARGYSPNLVLPRPLAAGWGAVGGHLKVTVAFSTDAGVVLSPHLGDMDSALSRKGFDQAVESLQQLFASRPRRWAHDAHPDYFTTRQARALDELACPVQHHVAHISAVMAEHGISGPVLGVAWDGNGLGDDRTLWGGEFLCLDRGDYRRFAHLRPFRLPGGASAMREPRRAAFGLLYELAGEEIVDWETLPPVGDFTRAERTLLLQALRKKLNAPETSSLGRLFDAVAALTGVCLKASYEGQAAGELEAIRDTQGGVTAYEFSVSGPSAEGPEAIDWAPAIDQLLADIRDGKP